jgi:hypothetical protein
LVPQPQQPLVPQPQPQQPNAPDPRSLAWWQRGGIPSIPNMPPTIPMQNISPTVMSDILRWREARAPAPPTPRPTQPISPGLGRFGDKTGDPQDYYGGSAYFDNQQQMARDRGFGEDVGH